MISSTYVSKEDLILVPYFIPPSLLHLSCDLSAHWPNHKPLMWIRALSEPIDSQRPKWTWLPRHCQVLDGTSSYYEIFKDIFLSFLCFGLLLDIRFMAAKTVLTQRCRKSWPSLPAHHYTIFLFSELFGIVMFGRRAIFFLNNVSKIKLWRKLWCKIWESYLEFIFGLQNYNGKLEPWNWLKSS